VSQPPFRFATTALATAPKPPELSRMTPCPQLASAIQGSRRRKLWEISTKTHCPIIGVCFSTEDLRALISKVMNFPRGTSDYTLHTTAVSACDERSQLAELLHKALEKRFQLTIRRFSAARDGNALRALWLQATSSGCEIPAALWASWTHPACDAQLEQEIYGDIHMIQHQIGSGMRADLHALQALRADNEQLRQELAAARRANESLRNEKSRETQALGQRVAELRAELAGKDAQGERLASEIGSLRQALASLRDQKTLARRASDAEDRANALSVHSKTLEDEVLNLRRLLTHANVALKQLTATDENCLLSEVDRKPPSMLDGKCVLCVGGRTGAVDAYRQLIENRGGRFLHHDGGLEESLHRIDSALAAADLVICQAGCISHNAYWRVKEQCKRSGKRCIYMKSAGVSGLSRLIDSNASLTVED
jgi:phosphoribosylcarboxyaminoimidazole (NCAIR) mutase